MVWDRAVVPAGPRVFAGRWRTMRKLAEVKEAKALMTEAVDWSVFRWLFEKRRVREIADEANAALDRLEQEVKAGWCDQLKAAYDELLSRDGGAKQRRRKPLKASKKKSAKTMEKTMDMPKSRGTAADPAQASAPPTDPELRLLAERVKQADDEAYRVHLDAEETFDEADRQMSTGLAREGCHKAIRSWMLHEKAIRLAEEAGGKVGESGAAR